MRLVAHVPTPIFSLVALATAACGGDDVAAPTIPDVSGVYDIVQVTPPPSCDPESAAEPLDAALGHGTFHLKLKFEQQGAQLTYTLLEFEGQAPNPPSNTVTTSIDQSGRFHIQNQVTSQPTIFGVGTFFEEISSTADGRFDTSTEPITFSASGEATHIFHQESLSGPVFATCTQSETETGTRTSS
jgi:hypothetical protein